MTDLQPVKEAFFCVSRFFTTLITNTEKTPIQGRYFISEDMPILPDAMQPQLPHHHFHYLLNIVVRCDLGTGHRRHWSEVDEAAWLDTIKVITTLHMQSDVCNNIIKHQTLTECCQWSVGVGGTQAVYPGVWFRRLAFLSRQSLWRVLDQCQHAHHRMHRLDFDSSPPLCGRKFWGGTVGWPVGEVSLSPGCGYWPSDLKVSAWPRPPEDMLGVTLCHTGSLQKLRRNRKRSHMLWPLGECHCPCLLP